MAPTASTRGRSTTDDTPKPRRRASVACSSCRERRTRCVILPWETACTQCREAEQECVIKHDDQRRRPASKSYVSQLEDRINQLEKMLREREKDESKSPSTASIEAPPMQPLQPVQSLPSDTIDFALPAAPLLEASSSSVTSNSTDGQKESMVHKLVSTRAHLSFDQLAGRLRYFGPTTNCHIYAELAAQDEENQRRAREQDRRTQRVLVTLGQETHDYLMDLFWQHYNSVIHVIHRGTFEDGLRAGAGPFYSGFLHICILATGYRFADKQRPDMVRITRHGRESSIHQEAKLMLDYEIERPGGIPFIGALLLLGDLEVGCGRDSVGWLYSGMANRLCFDIGLHLDATDSGLSQREIEIGRMTLWACVIYDRYWALFLGRPTALKPEDLEIYRLSQQFDRLGTCEPAGPGPEQNLEKQIYEALLELMELAGKITEIMDKVSKHNGASLDQHVFIRMSALDRELETWYARLPPALLYNADNVKTCPFSFFLLHQQFYSAKILLHRQFAEYDNILDVGAVGNGNGRLAPGGGSDAIGSQFSALARSTCTTSAGHIAQIFWQHRQRFDTRRIFVTGLQHAGNAATALVAAIVSAAHDRAAYHANMKYLECLTAALEDMSETYQPAERMVTVLHAVLLELRELQPGGRSSTSIVPARRASSADFEEESPFLPFKKVPSMSAGHPRYSGLTAGASLQTRPSPVYATHDPNVRLSAKSPPASGTFSLPTPGPSANQDGFTLISTDKTTAMTTSADLIHDPWPNFNSAPNAFPIDSAPVAVSAPSSSAFLSVWAGAETPTFSPLVSGSMPNDSVVATASSASNAELLGPNDMDMEFMSLLNEASVGDSAAMTRGTPSTGNRLFKRGKANGPESYYSNEDDYNRSADVWNELLRTNS